MYRRKLFESQSMRLATVNAIIRTLHEQNNWEEQHSRRVSELNVEIGQALGLKNEIIEGLRNMGMLHEIGKIAVPEAMLNKNENLTPEELKQIRRHPEIGYHILSSVNDMAEMAEYVLAHHERWDGQGYPRRLRRKDIPLQARITAVPSPPLRSQNQIRFKRTRLNLQKERYATKLKSDRDPGHGQQWAAA
ncbi:MAG TPA: HD domain-containing phosphohydrolase [Dehalococcoidales bacterium]|nr:HD domain-containing phosphohydrolase [Dehalococcoidales bacterium]